MRIPLQHPLGAHLQGRALSHDLPGDPCSHQPSLTQYAHLGAWDFTYELPVVCCQHHRRTAPVYLPE